MNRFARLVMACAGVACVAGTAAAADQTIQGRLLTVKDGSGGGVTAKRKVLFVAIEGSSANTLVGDPTGTPGGAILKLFVNGANPTTQTIDLPQGTASTGRPFWTVTPTGFKYRDPKGDNSAVRLLTVKRSPGGLFLIKGSLSGKNGQVDVLPPNPGTDAYVTLRFSAGDRYCVKYGADGHIKNNGNRVFVVKKPVAEGCFGSPSGAFLSTRSDRVD
jgi:hypothetical protein